MNMAIYYLQARSPFHFGVRGVGVEATEVMAHADTLFAALCLGLRELAGPRRLKEFLAAFPTVQRSHQRPPFLLSSAFPYVQYGQNVPLCFYPKPALPIPRLETATQDDPKHRKERKKISFVSETIFRAWTNGRDLSEHCDNEEMPYVLQDGQVWVAAAEWGALTAKKTPEELRFWRVERTTRVALDRAAHASQVYDVERVHFNEECGLWFAIRWLDETWREALEDVLRILGDVGLGGERSAGHGQFKLIEASEPVNLPDRTEPLQLTLSVYHPTKEEVEAGVLKDGQVSYQLLTRRGWLASPEGGGFRHRGVRMLAEGSVFHSADNDNGIYGDLVEVTPHGFQHHSVYRYGLAFPIGVAK